MCAHLIANAFGHGWGGSVGVNSWPSRRSGSEKAKKNVGAEKWQELSSEEKKRLTQIELENLLNPEW